MDFNTLKNTDTLKKTGKGICEDFIAEAKKIKSVNKETAKSAFETYFVDYLKKEYLRFDGRVSRRQYWMFALFSSLIGFVLGLVVAILPFLSFLSMLYMLALLVPSVGLAVRRLHDIDLSGWFFLICLIPCIGGLALILLFCLPGDARSNRFDAKVK